MAKFFETRPEDYPEPIFTIKLPAEKPEEIKHLCAHCGDPVDEPEVIITDLVNSTEKHLHADCSCCVVLQHNE